jgi:hypothetical protein
MLSSGKEVSRSQAPSSGSYALAVAPTSVLSLDGICFGRALA